MKYQGFARSCFNMAFNKKKMAMYSLQKYDPEKV